MANTKSEKEKEALDYMANFQNDPDFMKRMRERLGDKAFSNFMNLGANIMDIGISQSQISRANLLENQLKKPSIYSPTRGDDRLRAATADAQRGIYDTRAQLAPAELINMENYFNDLNTAKIASTGQAGSYGALAQGASLRRQRGGLGIAGMNAELISQNQRRYDDLVKTGLASNAAFEGRSLQANQLQLADYYKEAEANALLGSTGRANLRDSIYGIIPTLGDVASTTRQISRADYKNKSAGDIVDNFNSSITEGIGNIFNRNYGAQGGQMQFDSFYPQNQYEGLDFEEGLYNY